MSILDFLKKDKTTPEPAGEGVALSQQAKGLAEKEKKEVQKLKSAEEKSAEKVKVEKAKKAKITEEKKEPILKKKNMKREIGIGYTILKVPHISEKATDLLEKNQYIFNVSQTANKQEIKQAIKEIYNVDVVWVNVINIPRRKRRVGKTMGWKQGYRKAIVKIKEGQKIELLPR